MAYKVVLFHTLITILSQAGICQSQATVIQTQSTKTEGSVDIDNGYAQLHWTVANDIVIFKLQVKAKAWFAIGFGDGMVDVDMALIQVDDSNQATVTDLWSTGFYRPDADIQQDQTVLDQNVTDKSISVEFKRKLNTGDNMQDTILVVGSHYTWNFSYGKTTMMLGQHIQQGCYQVSFCI